MVAGQTAGKNPGILSGAWNWMKKNPGQAALLGAGAAVGSQAFLI